MAAETHELVTREEFERYKSVIADMFEHVYQQHVAVLKHVQEQHLAVLSQVSQQHETVFSLIEESLDVRHQRVLALQETFDNFTASVQAILGERVTDDSKPSVN